MCGRKTLTKDIASIIEEMNLYRTRVMRLPKKRCLSWHSDPAPRVHIPIDTREGCLFILEDKNYHLKNDGFEKCRL